MHNQDQEMTSELLGRLKQAVKFHLGVKVAIDRLLETRGFARTVLMRRTIEKNKHMAQVIAYGMRELRLAQRKPWEEAKRLFASQATYPQGVFSFYGYQASNINGMTWLLNPDHRFFEHGRWSTQAVALVVTKMGVDRKAENMTDGDLKRTFK